MPARSPLSANMGETVNPRKFSVEGESGMERMTHGAGSSAAPETEVVAKAKRRRFTAEYKRKIVREADGCKTPGRGRGAAAA